MTQKRHRAAAASCGVFADPGWRKAHGRDLLEALTSLTMRLLAAPGSILSLVAVLVRSYLLLKNAESYVRSYVQLFPERHRPTARSFFAGMHRMMLHWTRTLVLVALATVLMHAIAFCIMSHL